MITKIERGVTHEETISFSQENCCNCGIPFFMPTYKRKELMANPGTSFFCPNGHQQHYTGKTEAQKLKEQLDKEKLDRGKSEEDLTNRWLDALSEKSKLEKQLKRVKKVVCPCCNRTFADLQRHMQTKHPERKNQQQ